MPFPTVARIEAVSFRGSFDSGRTHPCIFSCENRDGSLAGDYVVKLAGGMERGAIGLACEFVSSRLATLLGIPVPAPAVIQISKELVETVRDAESRRILEKSVGENFGTVYLSGGYSTWPAGQPIMLSQTETAADIFAFDTLISNIDRRREKPNLLFRGDELFAIDHEMAFAFMQYLDKPKDIADNCTAGRMEFLKNHLFYLPLRKKPVDFSRLDGAAQTIDAATLASIEEDTPQAWKTRDFGPILLYVRAVLRRERSFTYVAKEVLAS